MPDSDPASLLLIGSRVPPEAAMPDMPVMAGGAGKPGMTRKEVLKQLLILADELRFFKNCLLLLWWYVQHIQNFLFFKKVST